MIERVIFFLDYPFDKRDYKRFGIEALKKNGFNIEVWDFVPLLHPAVMENVKVKDPMQLDMSFSRKGEAISAIKGLKQSDIVIFLIPYDIESLFIYRALSKVGVPYCVMAANSLPNIPKQRRNFLKFARIRNVTPENIRDLIFRYLPFRWMGVESASLLFAGGAASTPSNYPVDDNTERLWLHTFDYDLYLERLNETIEVNKKMGVFLDEYLPFHPDYVYSSLPVPETEDTYYEGLCEFFQLLESKYDANIVVAAHPRSHYGEHPDYFKGREAIRGNTLELVARSGFVICHSSTSINFAVLFRKPVIFITSNKIDQSWYGPYIRSMADAFGKMPINVDSNITLDFNKELEIDDDVYNEYKRSYIKVPESKDLPFWEIFSEHIIEYY
ncbi:hypothetical protein [uncultured Methanolobus sp.]|uniref:hypothetical protein n=1 Tax=uncultured Methanolobus sp. TaxID=218300 RepID=UPI0029C806E3|nr:hypothetical protein [uncultured Methanolobus sp.]